MGAVLKPGAICDCPNNYTHLRGDLNIAFGAGFAWEVALFRERQ